MRPAEPAHHGGAHRILRLPVAARCLPHGTSVNKIPAIARRSKSSRPTLFFSVFLLRSCHRCISHRTISGTSPRYRFSTTHSVLSAHQIPASNRPCNGLAGAVVSPSSATASCRRIRITADSSSSKRNIPENSAIRPDDFAWHRESQKRQASPAQKYLFPCHSAMPVKILHRHKMQSGSVPYIQKKYKG